MTITIGEAALQPEEAVAPGEQPQQEQEPGPSFWQHILTARTGEGPVSSYQDHPLCWDGSEEVARIIRGLSGLIDGLDRALVDIVIGALQLGSKMATAAKGGAPGGSDT